MHTSSMMSLTSKTSEVCVVTVGALCQVQKRRTASVTEETDFVKLAALGVTFLTVPTDWA